jgi:hypothetical protein
MGDVDDVRVKFPREMVWNEWFTTVTACDRESSSMHRSPAFKSAATSVSTTTAPSTWCSSSLHDHGDGHEQVSMSRGVGRGEDEKGNGDHHHNTMHNTSGFTEKYCVKKESTPHISR